MSKPKLLVTVVVFVTALTVALLGAGIGIPQAPLQIIGVL